MITNTIVPYCYDLAHILCMPSDLTHRFRYHNKWISTSIQSEGFNNCDCLIVLRNFETAELIPVRFAKITEVLVTGDIYYIEFKLLDHFPVEHINNVARNLNNTLQTKGYKNVQNEQLSKLIIQMQIKDLDKIPKQGKGQDIQRWNDFLNVIKKIECYSEYSFLKVYQIRDSKENQALIEKDNSGKYSYLLKPGKLYFLDVMQHVPWEIEKTESIKEPYDIELKTETDEIIVLRKVQRVVGKYDLLRFIFKTKSGFASKNTYLEVESRQGGHISKYGLPALFLPLFIKTPKWIQFVFGLRIFIGFIAIFHVLASKMLSSIYAVEVDWLRALALLVLIIVSNKWEDYVKELVKGIGAHKL